MNVENQTEHQHRFDAQGRQICCSQEEVIYRNANAAELLQGSAGADSDDHDHDHEHEHEHDHDDGRAISLWRLYLPAVFSLLALLVGIALDSYFKPAFFKLSVLIFSRLAKFSGEETKAYVNLLLSLVLP